MTSLYAGSEGIVGLDDADPSVWEDLLRKDGLWFGHGSEAAFADTILAQRRRQGRLQPDAPPLPHPYKILYTSRRLSRTRWAENQSPKHVTVPAHGRSVVTSMLISRGRVATASDGHTISIHSLPTGRLERSLEGHEGGVWAIAITRNTLVSGSTDRTVRVWDMESGRCTHTFGGHTSTVRSIAIVRPETTAVTQADGTVLHEKWPKRPLIVSGSRDHSLRVWTLPKPGDADFHSEDDAEQNPYHKLHLEGHDHAVRDVAARGRTIVSGSYDCTVRVWDIVEGTCKWVLVGHTQKVYSVALDVHRNIACSGSIDGTVRVWDIQTGQCRHVLRGHAPGSLVGLLSLSPSYLVSASSDSTVRVWDPDTGEELHALTGHDSAVTCAAHDEFKILSGSDGALRMWNIKDGSQVRDLLSGVFAVWQVAFEGRWCVAASSRIGSTVLDIWDFASGEEDEGWAGEALDGIYDEYSDEDD